MNLALRRMPAITPTDRAALVSDANRGRGFEVARQLSEYGVTVLPGARRHYRRLVNPSSGCAGVAKRSSKSALSAYVRALAMELEGGGICAYRDRISGVIRLPSTIVMPAKVSAGRNTSRSACLAYSIDTIARTAVVKIAPT